ncbi:MAG TPA: UDP-glucuronic acid decarboxylase family protein [Steroidobacteraceae bacterium]|nr:UDP-glucuronic acid decarboxylase family protein [Steroidobacteraceae bacterium]
MRPVEPMRASPMVVAGGAGFLGSHLCEHLLQLGHSVLCIDDLTTGALGNLDELMEEPRFRVTLHDIAEPLDVAEPLGIFNLACPASPVHYQADPIRTTMTSVSGTYNLLEIARRCGAPMLQASTSEVYGDPAIHPQSEHYWGYVNPAGVRSCYDEGKRCAESLCFDYRRTNGVDVRVARIFNTYGPRMAVGDGRVVTNFIVQALRNQPLTIYGNGSQTRSFCYVDDLIEGLVLLMSAPRGVKTPMNLGNPEEFTILELAELVIELTGSRSRMTFRPLPGDDPTQRCPDIGLARQELDWQPRVPLREGLRRSIGYMEGALKTTRTPRKPRLPTAGSPDAGRSVQARAAGKQVGDARGR